MNDMQGDALDTIVQPSTPKSVSFIPYGRQLITDEDIAEVTAALRSDFLTQGPAVPQFERSIAEHIGAEHVVACSNGTAALHLAMLALKIKPGDVVVTSPNTFAASANCARYVGADVQFVDIDPATGLMDIDKLASLLAKDSEKKIKAVIPVHYAGQPIDLAHLYGLVKGHGAWVVDDACHALGATYGANGDMFFVGGAPHSDLTVFSFHPVKHVATGEGGAVATRDAILAKKLQTLRTHGITRDDFIQGAEARSSDGSTNPWYYEMQMLGFNYRLTDIQAALGTAQMRRLAWSVKRRNEIAEQYRLFFSEHFDVTEVHPLALRTRAVHAWHLYVLQIDFRRLRQSRASVMNRLRAQGIGTQVHYIPVHLHPYYRSLYGYKGGEYPQAEAWYEKALSIPMYPSLTEEDVERVTRSIQTILHP